MLWVCAGVLSYGVLLFGIMEDRSFASIQSLNELKHLQFLKEQVQQPPAKKPKSQGLRGSTPSNEEEEEEYASDTHKEDKNNQDFDGDFLLWHTIMSCSMLCYLRRRSRMHPLRRPFSSLERLQVLRRRLNQQRREQGEGPLSTESLRLIVQEQDFGADDYERLWAFQNEQQQHSNNQTGAVRGATREEIQACPQRIMQQEEVSQLLLETNDRRHDHSHCVICLERYQVDEAVRTIPCMHSFHSTCVDRWMQNTAICPICKQSIAS
jgi:hypothetical protein